MAKEQLCSNREMVTNMILEAQKESARWILYPQENKVSETGNGNSVCGDKVPVIQDQGYRKRKISNRYFQERPGKLG